MNIDPLREINKQFDKAMNGKKWVPTIAEASEILRVPCRECNGYGSVRASFVPEGGMAPVACRKPCPKCSGLIYEDHRFPAAIVTLAKNLAHQDELTIARTLAGVCMGMQFQMSDLPWTILGLSLLMVSVAGYVVYRVGYEVGWHESKDVADGRMHDREMERSGGSGAAQKYDGQ